MNLVQTQQFTKSIWYVKVIFIHITTSKSLGKINLNRFLPSLQITIAWDVFWQKMYNYLFVSSYVTKHIYLYYQKLHGMLFDYVKLWDDHFKITSWM